jgi:hypothetical protein
LDIKSRLLKEFIKEITYNNRNPQNLRALELLDDKQTNPHIIINTTDVLYRARIVTNIDEIGKKEGFYGYDADKSFVPPAKHTRDGRANYRYIPYLYCANHPYLAISEVRPRLGATVSIATITANEPLTLLDFTIQHKPSKMSEAKENLFADLSTLFSLPVINNDDIIEYIPTQFIAEYAKRAGYDGIAFSSSITPEFHLYYHNRYNVVVFNYNKCEVKKSNLVSFENNHIECTQTDIDTERLNTNGFIEDQLDEILKIQDALINGTKVLTTN